MRLYNYWRSSSSYRVRLALAAKQLDYEYVAVSLLKGEQHEAAHLARNSWGSVPVLEVEEAGRAHFIPQSVAIMEYLEERFAERPLLPKAPLERARVRAMVELVNSSIQPFQNLSALNYLKTAFGADTKPWLTHWLERGLDALERQAKDVAGRFSFGDAFTLADACLLPQLFSARRFITVDEARYPTLLGVEAHCLTLDFVAKARPEAQPDAVR